jgi:hypothetical protein
MRRVPPAGWVALFELPDAATQAGPCSDFDREEGDREQDRILTTGWNRGPFVY